MDAHICLDTHKQIHTETYTVVHAQMQQCDMGQIQHPEETSEAQWIVTVADKEETDKRNTEVTALNDVKHDVSLFSSMYYSGLTVSCSLMLS